MEASGRRTKRGLVASLSGTTWVSRLAQQTSAQPWMRCRQKLYPVYLRWNRRPGISRIELETDCSQLWEAITSQVRDLAAGGGLFHSIQELLADNFHCNKIVNIPRSCNSSPHEIAKVALSWDPGQSYVWYDPLPEFVNNLVSRDLVAFTMKGHEGQVELKKEQISLKYHKSQIY